MQLLKEIITKAVFENLENTIQFFPEIENELLDLCENLEQSVKYTLYVKTKTKTCCKHNYPSPDGSGILLGRGSTQEIQRTAGNSS